jgi:hypothetical protein
MCTPVGAVVSECPSDVFYFHFVHLKFPLSIQEWIWNPIVHEFILVIDFLDLRPYAGVKMGMFGYRTCYCLIVFFRRFGFYMVKREAKNSSITGSNLSAKPMDTGVALVREHFWRCD